MAGCGEGFHTPLARGRLCLRCHGDTEEDPLRRGAGRASSSRPCPLPLVGTRYTRETPPEARALVTVSPRGSQLNHVP